MAVSHEVRFSPTEIPQETPGEEEREKFVAPFVSLSDYVVTRIDQAGVKALIVKEARGCPGADTLRRELEKEIVLFAKSTDLYDRQAAEALRTSLRG